MKAKMIIVLLVALNIKLTWAQEGNIEPIKGTVHYQETDLPCLEVHIDPETKTTKKAWKSQLKDQYDVKVNGFGLFSRKDVLYTDPVVFETISEQPIEIFAEITEDMNGTQMKVFAKQGAKWMSEDQLSAEFEKVEEMLINFLKMYLPFHYKEKVNDVEDRIQSLKKEINKLEADINDLNNDIEEAQNKIEELQSDLKAKQIQLEASKVEMEISLEKLKCRSEKMEKMLEKLRSM